MNKNLTNLIGELSVAKIKKNQFDPSSQEKTSKRIIGGIGQIKSDLFKLEVAECKVNKSYNEGDVDLYDQEHVHWFHTYDSDGKKHVRSNAVSGHFHMIEYQETGDDQAVKIISVSGPMHEVKRKERGRWVKKIEPVSDLLGDDHTHEITYKKTDIVEIRTQSANAINLVAQEANKTAPIPGVQ